MTDNNNHPIIPPQWQVDAWCKQALAMGADIDAVFLEAARWGADQELEACCEFEATVYSTDCADKLRRHRRPKPPSLKELALETLLSMQIQPCVINGINTNADLMAKYDILRRALESLPD